MPFPDLVITPSRTNVSEASGVPDNGVNEFAHAWPLEFWQIQVSQIEISMLGLGAGSVTGAVFLGLTADRLRLRVQFTQTGADGAKIVARHVHSASA